MEPETKVSKEELKIVFIDGFEKGCFPEVIYVRLKRYNIQSLRINNQKNKAWVGFPSQAIAKEAMLNQNGKPFLKKPIRMSLLIRGKAEFTEFSLEGLEKADLNKLYKIASKYGHSCKFGFRATNENEVMNKGHLSYTDFQQDKIEELIKELLAEGVICSFDKKSQKSEVTEPHEQQQKRPHKKGRKRYVQKIEKPAEVEKTDNCP